MNTEFTDRHGWVRFEMEWDEERLREPGNLAMASRSTVRVHRSGGSSHEVDVSSLAPHPPARGRLSGWEGAGRGRGAAGAAEHPLDHQRGPRPAHGLLRRR